MNTTNILQVAALQLVCSVGNQQIVAERKFFALGRNANKQMLQVMKRGTTK